MINETLQLASIPRRTPQLNLDWRMSADDKLPTRRNGCRYVPAAKVAWLTNAPVNTLCERETVLGLSPLDRPDSISLSEDAWSARGGRLGYRSVFGNVGVTEGDYYWECSWEANADNSSFRMGVANIQATVLGPVGIDAWGIGWCADGSIFCSGSKRPFSTGFLAGDLLGCRLNIVPPKDKGLDTSGWRRQKRIARTAVDYFGDYFEESCKGHPPVSADAADKAELSVVSPDLAMNFAEFYRNGVPEGKVALPASLLTRPLYPIFSLYADAKVSVNFGPTFVISPSLEGNVKPFSDGKKTFIAGGALTDLQRLSIANKRYS